MTRNANKLRFITPLLVATISLFLTLAAFAQNSSVSGRVMDSTGAVVPGASVSITSATGAIRTTVTNDTGVYQFPQMAPGTYQIKAELQGFKTVIKEKVDLQVDTPANVDFTLEVGNIAETVTVEAGASKLNTQDATIGNTFEGLRIRQLPLESRNVANLLSLQPGVTRDGYVSGARSDQSNMTLDGIDVNEQQQGTAFETVLRVTPDSVQEFRVTTTTPTAAQGRSSGGQVSLVSRTGSNEWHGSAYEFHRNTSTTANDFFNNRIGVKRPKLIRNLFGGSVSGPIKKDRIFFFYNYEGRRDAKETPVTQTVPLPSMGLGQLKYNTAAGVKTLTTDQLNALYPDVKMNPVAIAIFADAAKRYPANDTGQGDGLNYSGFRFNAPLPVKQRAHTATLLFNLTQDGKHTLFLRGNYQNDLDAGAPAWPDTPGTNRWSHPIGYTVQHTWTISPHAVNTFRYGLTRLAFSQQGDSNQNQIAFRFIYWARNFSRTLSRTTPVYNFVDDISWVKGNHTWQFGTNMRIIRNERVSYANSYDSAVTNPSFYASSGGVVLTPIKDITGSLVGPRNTVTALIGRFSQYSGNFNFGGSGSVLSVGQGVERVFATEEYEFYGQDTWRVTPNLTLTLGLRWQLNRPVYEANGLQVKPDVSLGKYFELRKQGMESGVQYDKTISLNLAGPFHKKPGFYEMEKNNFAPRAAFAWSPSFDNKLLQAIFGTQRKSTIRGGFAMLYDRIGSQLAVSFDLNNTLGFSSSQTISANTYNVTTKPAPLFTGYGQAIRTLPGITVPSSLKFPLTHPADGRRRIESTLDDSLTTPAQYSWDFAIGREFAHGLTVELSYIGRAGRNLLAQRDVMQPNNMVDPTSKMDWYTAGGMLVDLREKNTPWQQVPKIAFFESFFPNLTKLRDGLEDYYGPLPAGNLTASQMVYLTVARGSVGGYNTPDYTTLQDALDSLSSKPNLFYQPQYGALAVFSTMARSDYHAGAITLRERFRNSFTMDFNYTFSKSIDTASGLERAGSYGAAFIENALRPDDNKGVSDFDITHMINANSYWELPFGRGRAFLSNMHPVLNHILGGWQLTNVFRWNSGLPRSAPYDAEVWATNWNAQSWGSRIRPIESSPTKGGAYPNLFKDPQYAYNSFRNARPGETGERNILRLPGYVALDFGLGKSFKILEGHTLQFRWEVFNATNTQMLGALNTSRSGFGLSIDPHIGKAAPEFGRFTGIQGDPRIMQFALRYDF